MPAADAIAQQPTRTDTVLLVGFDAPSARRIEERWPFRQPVLESVSELGPALEAGNRAPGRSVVCFGDGPAPAEIARAIRNALPADGDPPRQFLVLAAEGQQELFAELVDQDHLFFLGRQLPSAAAITDLLIAAVRSTVPAVRIVPTSEGLAATGEGSAEGRSAAEARWSLGEPSPDVLRRIGELERARGLLETVEHLEKAALELVPSRLAVCRFVDPHTLTLWRPGPVGGDELAEEAERDSAVAGLVGFVARTGRTVDVPRLEEDGRWDPEADNGGRPGQERFLAVALPGRAGGGGPEPGVEAVLGLSRGARQEPFHEAERRQLEHLAREAGPILRRRRLAVEQARQHQRTQVFRLEALEHRERGQPNRAEPLRVVPSWLGRAYRAIVGLCLAVLVAAPFVGSDEFALGTASVRLGEQVEVRARSAGVLAELHVRPGDRVRAGQELGRLDSSRERAELEQLDRELEQRLVERLRRPEAAADTSGFVALRERRRVAEARLEQLALHAPVDAVVGDLLIRAERPVAAGQPVVSLSAVSLGAVEGRAPSANSHPRIEILLPGQYRPLLEPGMEVRFRIAGYDDVELMLEVSEVGDRVISPEWAARILDSGTSGASGTSGGGGREGLVIVRADLPASTFESGGQHFPYFDGMAGTAEIRVRHRRFVLDWLRSLRSGSSP